MGLVWTTGSEVLPETFLTVSGPLGELVSHCGFLLWLFFIFISPYLQHIMIAFRVRELMYAHNTF